MRFDLFTQTLPVISESFSMVFRPQISSVVRRIFILSHGSGLFWFASGVLCCFWPNDWAMVPTLICLLGSHAQLAIINQLGQIFLFHFITIFYMVRSADTKLYTNSFRQQGVLLFCSLYVGPLIERLSQKHNQYSSRPELTFQIVDLRRRSS